MSALLNYEMDSFTRSIHDLICVPRAGEVSGGL
jgi:hypothetical protein